MQQQDKTIRVHEGKHCGGQFKQVSAPVAKAEKGFWQTLNKPLYFPLDPQRKKIQTDAR